MKTKYAISLFLLSCTFQLFSQLATLTTLDNYYPIEYEAAYPGSYFAELLDVWAMGNLDNGESYKITFFNYGGSDDFDDVVYSSTYDYYWDKPDDPTPSSQVWTWRGPDNSTDYFSLDVYIDDYSEVELGISDQIFLSVNNYPNTLSGATTATIVTSSAINGPVLDCSNPVQYSISEIGVGGTASWVIKQFGNTKASGSGATATASNLSTGAFEVVYTISFPNEDLESLIITKNCWFGKFENTPVTGETGVCPFNTYPYTAQIPVGSGVDYTYSWTYPSNWDFKYTTSNILVIKTPYEDPDYGYVQASITNACGASSYYGIYVGEGYSCGGYYMIMPNPSSSYIDLDINPSKIKAEEEINDWEILLKIYDKMGAIVHTSVATSLPYRIDTSNIPEGEYIVYIVSTKKNGKENEKRVESIQIIVGH